jgi:hypothetical protein
VSCFHWLLLLLQTFVQVPEQHAILLNHGNE